MLSNIAIQRASTGICVKNWAHATKPWEMQLN